MHEDWKMTLKRLKPQIPEYRHPIRRKIAKKEVTTREKVEICRISEKVIRKRKVLVKN